MPDLKLYTVAELREWLLHNAAYEGLSGKLISPARVWAIIHNPYVKEDDPVLAAIFVDGKNVAYVSAFPEEIEGKRFWWLSGLWCDPEYQGNGYGLIVIGSLAEVYGYENCLDRWGRKETVEIFTYLGHKTLYTPRYVLAITSSSRTVKSKIKNAIRLTQRYLHRLIERPHKKEAYSLRYLSYIDDATYEFIRLQRGSDYFLHSQEFLNWVLRYPFNISAPLVERVGELMPFSQSEMRDTQLFAVNVYDGEALIGFYLLKKNGVSLHVLYLYYEEAQKFKVFASIRDHIISLKIPKCITENKFLADYLQTQIYFPLHSKENISFSIPNISQRYTINLQYGDGDCFLV